jgi:hypothetical protein
MANSGACSPSSILLSGQELVALHLFAPQLQTPSQYIVVAVSGIVHAWIWTKKLRTMVLLCSVQCGSVLVAWPCPVLWFLCQQSAVPLHVGVLPHGSKSGCRRLMAGCG